MKKEKRSEETTGSNSKRGISYMYKRKLYERIRRILIAVMVLALLGGGIMVTANGLTGNTYAKEQYCLICEVGFDEDGYCCHGLALAELSDEDLICICDEVAKSAYETIRDDETMIEQTPNSAPEVLEAYGDTANGYAEENAEVLIEDTANTVSDASYLDSMEDASYPEAGEEEAYLHDEAGPEIAVPDTSLPPVNAGNVNQGSDFAHVDHTLLFHISAEMDNLPAFINMEMVIAALYAQEEANIPASITLAQIILESGYGDFGPGGEDGEGLSWLAFRYNNLFHIQGESAVGSVDIKVECPVRAEDDQFCLEEACAICMEEENQYLTFRIYNTFTESIADRTEFLEEAFRDLLYRRVNANEFAWQLGRRWESDFNYGLALITVMHQYDLSRFDALTMADYHHMIGAGRFIHPVPGSTVTSGFGWRDFDQSFHQGLDLGTGTRNLPIYAAYSGVVTYVGYASCAGNWIIIDHGDGLTTMYMHNLANFVEIGQRVLRGQQIALTGSTGRSTGNHLHFQVEVDGIAIDPAPLLGMARD